MEKIPIYNGKGVFLYYHIKYTPEEIAQINANTKRLIKLGSRLHPPKSRSDPA
ncbi:MAG: hypothetical protein WD712_03010 [Candidatus Spechtbacterales bacterium]